MLLCGALVMSGCTSAGAPSYGATSPAEAAPAPSPAPESDGYGYSFDDRQLGPVAVAASDADFAQRQKSSHSRAKEGGGMPARKEAPPSGQDVAPPTAPDQPGLPPAESTPTDQSRKPLLIYSARLGLAVFKVQEQLDTIEKLAKERGGYLVTRTQNEIRVRVPAEHFQAAIEAILKLGDVNFRQVTTDDVTAEYTDLEIRLNNALSVRSRLQALLDKAQKVEEALQVERELQRLTDEIETMKGRLKLLQELAAYSTIDVAFQERSSALKSRVELPFPWLESMGLEHLLSL